eukprot:1181420-Karenia_brevis.AAC.1
MQQSLNGPQPVKGGINTGSKAHLEQGVGCVGQSPGMEKCNPNEMLGEGAALRQWVEQPEDLKRHLEEGGLVEKGEAYLKICASKEVDPSKRESVKAD